jgi:DNA ligase 1
LLQRSFQERRKLLYDNFVEVKGEFAFAKNMDATSVEEIQAFLEESVKDSCEGLMVKMLTGEGSSYEPSKRSMNWLKVTSPTNNPSSAQLLSNHTNPSSKRTI